MARRYDFDYNFDPEGTSLVQPDPYTDPGSPQEPVRQKSPPRRSPTPPPPPIQPREPSKEYLSISAEPSSKLETPSSQRKLLILDLNGTLVYRSPHQRRSVYQQPHHVPRPLRSVHPRPYLSSFKEYLFHPRVTEWLDTMVWSSAQPHSVDDMVGKTFGSKDGLKAVWARDTLGLTPEQYFRKTQTTKDLEKPWAALGHSARTTFLLDDSPLKAHLQPWNHLCIREYVAEMRQTDVKVRDAEILREQKEQSQTTPPVEEEGEEEDSRKRKRKAKKERKKAERLASAKAEALDPMDAGGRPLEYDQTLLAIIGVLDTIKNEDNVAGWMRNGGLVRSGHYPRPSPGPSQLTKRRRVSDESRSSLEEPPPSPPPSSDDQPPVHDVSGEVKPPEAATNVPLDVNLWFENRDAFAYWTDRGRRALEDLGIELKPGVVGSNG
ncbi:phosphoprotein phosphatase [Coprinopsis cinerea okayama7|uniref:Mitochondrial import inner membrane translocase subunit TIM50 n=1 Tax=Coprinopsis cinerea (strain Okayama-7 / 130 / ATCC MYA-4618 / FGSC 9003) TaxID=240176 RepID=A8PBG6_COPC7|nr:phosphoprotein phosphatase [Coprinopsis cinerea okayama7\|eukprot:XP_001840178.2 phosphoprotein phosphatase [Coprinopsis cinerea okayama7\